MQMTPADSGSRHGGGGGGCAVTVRKGGAKERQVWPDCSCAPANHGTEHEHGSVSSRGGRETWRAEWAGQAIHDPQKKIGCPS